MTGAAVMTVRSESPYATAVFRAAVDCARLRLPDLPLVLVDDCSPEPGLLAALADWDRHGPDIHVIYMGAPRAVGLYQPPQDVQPGPTSYGHAPSLDRGLWYAYHVLHAPWALTLDGDVFLLAEDMPARVAAAAAHLSDDCVVAGEWVGTPSDYQAVHWCDAVGHSTNGHVTPKALEPVGSAIRAYGYINKQCSLVYLPQFWHPLAEPLQNSGWVSNTWFYSQMALGRRAWYVPFFRDETAVHLGAVAVAPGRGWGETGNVEGRRYGQKHGGNYYAGYLQIPDLPSFQQKLAARSPGEPVPRAWFRAPADQSPEYPWRYLRYGTAPAQPLIEDQTLTFEWVDRPSGDTVVAHAETVLEGEVCRIVTVDGEPTAARECYQELFEHTTALRRSRVWTPTALATRLTVDRQVDEQVDGYNVFFWRHIIRSGPRWRWAEHFGWGNAGRRVLETAA